MKSILLSNDDHDFVIGPHSLDKRSNDTKMVIIISHVFVIIVYNPLIGSCSLKKKTTTTTAKAIIMIIITNNKEQHAYNDHHHLSNQWQLEYLK